ncbi:hypothetical protein SAMN06265339_1386 [Desulfurobacterium pacificum]|uniref:HAMP domain-containing protein n=1 Tax=Desulfurobacterium pacificum TaxID=240166 RepID=A0ABY1NRB8_9BACT|nr:histidine kinase [Desulfurobacterium pacificum]SMP15369.1 hypothetical protein SAMN06265339_1386 [Desulfurobacterium pacificum]
MKKILRAFFMSDLPIRLAYPVRMGLFYYTTAFIFLVVAYFVVADTVKEPALAKLVFEKLLVAIIVVGLFFFVVTYVYSRIVSEDYEKITNFAESLSKGNLDKNEVKLSSLADVDLIKIKEALERLRNSLLISKELLKKKGRG